MKNHPIHTSPEERLAFSLEQNTEAVKEMLAGASIFSVQGRQGERGFRGEKGERGERGRDGADGNPGKDGVNGENGKDGSPDTPEEVRDKLVSLKGKNRLPASAIKGLEELRTEVDTMNQMGVVAGGGPTYVWMDDAVRISDHIREINFGSGISASYNSGRITLTATGSSVATEKLTPTTSGDNITLDLTGLANTFSTIQWVAKNGQILDSADATFGWSRVANTITVLTAANTDIFLVHYTYA